MKRFLSIPLLLLCLYSCQNQSYHENKDYAPVLKDSVSVYGFTGDSVKLVKTAGLRFKVKNVEQSLRSLSELAQSHGGRIYDQTFQSGESGRKELKLSDDSLLVITTLTPQADVTVRVPSANLESFLFGATALGYYTDNSHLKLDDRSLAYLQNALLQKARAEILAKQPAAKPTVAGNQQALALKDEAIAQYIANKSTDADAVYSTVTLNIFQNTLVQKERIANYTIADYELPFSQRLLAALQKGGEGFLAFLLALVYLWPLLLLTLAGFVIYRFYLVKKKSHSLAQHHS